ncbi:MAG: hypothetical protein JWM63_3837, partial [Gammaproteobacteria bacterium]|nr:hypothetical protein [Gammaproteobacteria bacterium]
ADSKREEQNQHRVGPPERNLDEAHGVTSILKARGDKYA